MIGVMVVVFLGRTNRVESKQNLSTYIIAWINRGPYLVVPLQIVSKA